jgi:HSP20 family protein
MESFFDSPLLTRTQTALGGVPAIDVIEKDDAYVLEAELPGYDEKDVNLSLDGGAITIESAKTDAAEKKADGNRADERDDKRYIVRERRSSTFSRSFRLPENADNESISAGFKNGLLTLEIKKRTEAQKRVIQIN